MNVNKRSHLKKMAKLNILAAECGISPMTLSRIINNRIKPSYDLARRLANKANELTSSNYFNAQDFIPNTEELILKHLGK